MSKVLTLGVFLSSTQNSYENALYRGILEAATEAGAHVICFTSGALRAFRGFEFQRNVLYDLVNADNVDGLIFSGTLAHPISPQEMQEFFQRYRHFPRVSVALEMPGTPCVMVDNRQGVCEAVNHLIEVHGRTRLAFIRGPLGQQEAEERFQAFCQTLADHRLAVDESLLVRGDYSKASGAAAMRVLLARPCLDFQAVVSANDSMALGALEVMQEAGVCVPEQIALTGFDDDFKARFASVPITSVRQNISDQGALAVRLLLAQIAGWPVSEKNISAARLVVRRSCGCGVPDSLAAGAAITPGLDWAAALQRQRPAIVAAVCSSLAYVSTAQVTRWSEAWLLALEADLAAGESQAFLHALEQVQREGFDLGLELSAWQRALETFIQQVLPCLPEAGMKQRLVLLEEQALLRLGTVMEHLENASRIEVENREQAVRELSETLTTTFDMAGILEVLNSELARLNVSSCYLSLFEDPQNPADLSRLIFAWQDRQRIPLPAEGVQFPSMLLVPQQYHEALTSTSWVVEALYSKEDRLGFVLFDVEARSLPASNALRALLSGALQGVLLLEQRRKAEEKLIQQQHQLEALVDKLEYANRELEYFIYSVSHDLRSPLRAIAGYASILEREHHPRLNEEARQLLDHVVQNAKRMGWLIDDLLAFSRIGRSELKPRLLDMNELVSSVLLEVASDSENRKIEWIVEELPPATGDLALLRQVWVNLIQNAVKYSAKASPARVHVGSEKNETETVYFVRDNGVGFDMRYIEKLFGVFQRLHRDEEFPGTGIGLAIAKRIILRHGGRIWADAKLGEGAVFYFTLP